MDDEPHILNYGGPAIPRPVNWAAVTSAGCAALSLSADAAMWVQLHLQIDSLLGVFLLPVAALLPIVGLSAGIVSLKRRRSSRMMLIGLFGALLSWIMLICLAIFYW
jgi:hypothetical protein